MLDQISEVITAVGGLGLAAYSLVDTSKLGQAGGVSHSGFSAIEAVVKMFLPEARLPAKGDLSTKALPMQKATLQTLHAQWINGVATVDQKTNAKALIKFLLSPENAKHMAEVTNVDADGLILIATNLRAGKDLDAEHSNLFARFDLALTALIDAAYQRADQRYRNTCKVYAALVAIILSLVGGVALELSNPHPNWWRLGLYAMGGLLAVPLAPITKDLTSALTTAVKAAQSFQKPAPKTGP